MHTTTLRKVGGSIMLTLPPVLLDILHLQPGTRVGLSIQGGQLVVEPRPRSFYSLDELLAQCDSGVPPGNEEREWLDDKPVGRELL